MVEEQAENEERLPEGISDQVSKKKLKRSREREEVTQLIRDDERDNKTVQLKNWELETTVNEYGRNGNDDRRNI